MVIAPRLDCRLLVAAGPSRRVGPSGVWIGRQPDCDLVTADPSASRRHALVRLTSDGVELVPLGRKPVQLNGAVCDKARALADGDVLEVPGLRIEVQLEARPPSAGLGAYVIERAAGGVFGLAQTPFVVGGGAGDDLIIDGWPPGPLRFHLAQADLYVEACAPAVTVCRPGGEERELELGVLEPVDVGAEVAYEHERFVIRRADRKVVTTAVTGVAPTLPVELPRRVEVETLPRGGRLVLTFTSGARAVYLADRRFELVLALLSPGKGHGPGEFLSDDALRALVWPRAAGPSRQEINTLISRCRKDLVDAGLAGPRLIERAPGGGGTRFCLAAGAEVEVLS
ncbi:MAG: FHA domain-containing protein [Kofleriaceae bacterium]|nr:FHA domain-containing protein [Kofleriaceae bacterium]